MHMDVTPLVPQGRQLINSYGDGGYTIAGQRYEGSVLIFPEQTMAWDVTDINALTLDHLQPFLEAAQKPEILVLGCGASIAFIEPDLRQAVRDHGIVIEALDSGAAARTYNVLLTEDRSVAAALIAL